MVRFDDGFNKNQVEHQAMRNPGANRDDYGEFPLGISPGEHRLVTILRASLKKGADPSSKKDISWIIN
jgi:hypothetical protein